MLKVDVPPQPKELVRAKKGCRRCHGTGCVGYRDVGVRGDTRSRIACRCIHQAVKEMGWSRFYLIPGAAINADEGEETHHDEVLREVDGEVSADRSPVAT